MTNRIREYLGRNGHNGAGLAEHLNDTGIDKRYKAHLLAGTTNGTSGIIQYKGIKYYFHCIAPWTYCPAGEITVEISK